MTAPRTLIFTTGETPQVVTETLWALATQDPPWLPDRIVLATTARGARVYRHGRSDTPGTLPPLLGENGKLAQLWRTLALGQPLPPVDVLVPQDKLGPIEDLRTEAEVEAFAEALLAEVARVTAEPQGELHLSLAGGRKTMSFLAGQVLSLLARPQDVLSHVLIEPAELESPKSGFWWPGDGSPGSEAAQVRLHLVPFLRARAWADPETILAGPEGGRFRAALDRANLGLGDPDVVLDLASGQIMAGGQSAKLGPSEAAAVALVFVAGKRGARLSSTVDDQLTKRPSLDGDPAAAGAVWAWLRAGSQWSRHLAGSTSLAGARNLFEDSIAKHHKVDFESQLGSFLSKARNTLRRKFTPVLSDRMLKSDKPLTAIPPHRLTILVPAELADHPDRPPETEPAPAG